MAKNLTILGLVLALLTLIVALQYFGAPDAKETPETPSELPPGSHAVVFTDDGFTPKTLTIKKGETIVFSNKTGTLFWPASNLHPSHLMYADFDPKEPVAANATWSFTFDQVGEWEYHDHLAPYHTGVITVVE